MQIDYAGAVKLVLFDVDGVLTDGGLYLGPSGELLKKFDWQCRCFVAMASGVACCLAGAVKHWTSGYSS